VVDEKGGEMGGELVELRRLVEARAREEEDARPGGPGDGGEIPRRFVRECLAANELGDGMLYAHLNAGKFLYAKTLDKWLVWAGHHWEIDMMGRALAAVEALCPVYAAESERVAEKLKEAAADKGKGYLVKILEKKKAEIAGRISRLRSTRGRKAVLEFAQTLPENALAIAGDEIDTRPWLLPCTNGVVDLRTGELGSGRPEDYLMKACPVEWRGIDAPRPAWEAFMDEIMDGNPALVSFLQRALGMALVGEVLEGVFVVLNGKGRNGKGTLVETVCRLLGPLASPIRSEMLLDQFRAASSSGPTPDIMALKGLRLAFASETDDGCKISPSKVKWLTGNDTLTGRKPHGEFEVTFRPSHSLFLQTNHLPTAPADDFAFWERMLVVPFALSFVNREPSADDERRADKFLAQKLADEMPGILAWLVEGCLLWQRDGLAPPPAVREACAEYRRDQDYIKDFIDECCRVDDAARVQAREVYAVFEGWWRKNMGKFPPKGKTFGNRFGKYFEREKEGITFYRGVGLTSGAYEYLPPQPGR
jgi:putative DNA primase/helicase